jgi:AcrR family transcriptional regulator
VSDARSRLLDAAEALLWERGVSATSPRAVLDASGVGHGSLYHHFPTKTALARATLDRVVSRALQRASEDLDTPGPTIQAVAGYLTRPREGVKGCQIGRHASDHAVVGDEDLAEPVRRYFLDLHTGVRDRLAAAKAQGDLPIGDVDDLADTVLATIQGGYVLARATGDQQHLDRATRGLVTLLNAATQRTGP